MGHPEQHRGVPSHSITGTGKSPPVRHSPRTPPGKPRRGQRHRGVSPPPRSILTGHRGSGAAPGSARSRPQPRTRSEGTGKGGVGGVGGTGKGSGGGGTGKGGEQLEMGGEREGVLGNGEAPALKSRKIQLLGKNRPRWPRTISCSPLINEDSLGRGGTSPPRGRGGVHGILPLPKVLFTG